MTNMVLETLVKDALDRRAESTIFTWQGGEPTLAGLDFFRLVVQLQMAYGASGQRVSNSLQTNGILLTPEWAGFLREYKFLVGLSVDGPADLHNKYRRDRDGGPTFDQVMYAMLLLRAYEVEFNVLALLNDQNVRHPKALYNFFGDNRVSHMQFVPCVEATSAGKPTPYSIDPEAYGDFLCTMFDLWAKDYPSVSIRDFDQMLLATLNQHGSICTHGESCEDYLVIEHNGDAYPCDFFVEPSLRLGNILENSVEELEQMDTRKEFAAHKCEYGEECLGCQWLAYCHGGCPKHRTALGGAMSCPSYFCRSYKQLYEHSMDKITELAAGIRS
jgi:uncharacterized protein